MKQTFRFGLSLIGGVILTCLSAFAQVTTSSISGKITDAEGVVVGAPVLVIHQDSGTKYYSVTDKNGTYRVNNITPGGPYSVVIEMLGYRKVETNGIYASLGETASVNVKLEEEALGLDAAIFVVDGNDSNMNISRAGAGTSISQRTMDALPTTSRSMNDIMKLTPQASSTSNGLAVGGGNYRSSYVTVDGAAFNNAFGIGSNLPAGGSPISLDALEQMSVNITPFDVRHSGFTGGAINAVTKSGTNKWHASVYNYFNSDQLKGDRVGDERVNLSKSLSNTTGITLGGPIVKDKLFFFVNAEFSPETTPGSTRVARKGEGDKFGGSTSVARPTEGFLNEVSDYLKKTYDYNPGRYQDYSVSTPDWKVMARIDWNINEDHKLNVRFSHTVNTYSSAPSNSISPFSKNVYDRNNYGRTSEYAMYFENSRYNQNQNFTSAAMELNSRFLEGRLNNVLRLTYSRQYENRTHAGKEFPTVDIMDKTTTSGGEEVDAVLTSFGNDPFTLGNLRAVSTVVATDEISYNVGINNIVAGVQFEWNDVKNGYMQGGSGFYVYNSWDDFKNNAAPKAFAITFPNNNALDQVYPSFQNMQASVYAQDELNISDNFKLTAGLRLEMPFYPTVKGNNNVEFENLANTSESMKGLRTDNMPKARLNVSPRIGFNWDILKNRSLVLRGGTGLYTGHLPNVWIVSSVGNSNCMQMQYIDEKGNGQLTPGFQPTVKDIVNEMYNGAFTQQDLPAPTATTIMDKNLKMPTTWKTSLALDGVIPGGIKASVEGIFNKDLTSVYVQKLGMVQDENGIQLPGEPEKRTLWQSENIKNSVGGTVQPVYITNVAPKGYYYSVTARMQKDFKFGLSLMAAYTYSDGMSVSDGIGDQVTSAFYTMTYGRNGSNVAELGHSTYVSPNRFIANISYRIQEGKFGASTLGLFYEGYNHCYVGGYSYTRYSYTMNNVTGDTGANNLIYIPTAAELSGMPFVSDENKAAYESFIAGDKYLSRHRGEYSQRGGAVAPWQSRFNFKFTQDINFNVNRETVHTLQIGFDINNIGNLINSKWGATDRLSSDSILSYNAKNGTYTFNEPTWTKYNSTFSTWEMLLSLRYFF